MCIRDRALKTSWGADYEQKLDVAGRGLAAAGLPKEVVDSLITSMGVDKVMEIGHGLGTKMGEAQLHQGSTTVDSKPATAYTRETAIEERNKMMADKVFFEKWQAGDTEALKKFDDVTRAIVGTPESWQPAPENFGRQGDGHGTEVFKGSEKWRG